MHDCYNALTLETGAIAVSQYGQIMQMDHFYLLKYVQWIKLRVVLFKNEFQKILVVLHSARICTSS